MLQSSKAVDICDHKVCSIIVEKVEVVYLFLFQLVISCNLLLSIIFFSVEQ